jgi:hypothetical protein
MQTFLQRIGVRYIDHAAGNARATGSAEVHQNIVERLFEGRLRVYAPRGLADLNARLDAWRCMFNAERQHSRHGKSRNALWLTITQDQLRLPASAEVLRELVSGPPRSVKVKGSLIIEYTPKGYERQSYSLRHIPGVHPGACVGVSVNAYDAPAVDVTVSSPDKPDVTYTLQPIARDRAGFAVDAPVIGEEYKAPKDTAADKALKAIERAAYAAPTLEAAKAAAKSGARPYADINIMADVEAARPHNYMQRSGRALVADARPTVRDLPPVSHYEAFVRLRPALERAGIEWTPEHMTHLKQRYPDGVPVEAIPALEAAFLARPSDNAAAGSTLRLAAGGAS